MTVRQPDPDIRARLTLGDAVVVCRELKSVFRTPPLSTARALLHLGRVDRLDKLGAAGPLPAATTVDANAHADPELRKFEAVFARDALRVIELIGGLFPRLRWDDSPRPRRSAGAGAQRAREEEPGKIVHELRDPTDPVAQRITAESGWGWPYYGAVDTTPLFIRGRPRAPRRLNPADLLARVALFGRHQEPALRPGPYWPGGYHTGSSWLWQSMHIADGLEQHGFALLAEELLHRCWHVHLRTGLLPEFARGHDDRGVLNDRIVDFWQAVDRRENRLEQPPLPSPNPLERDVLAELPDRP